MTEELKQDWFFTFGSNHTHPRGYVSIKNKTDSEARDAMIFEYGIKWSMQYDKKEFYFMQAEKYGLHEIKLGD